MILQNGDHLQGKHISYSDDYFRHTTKVPFQVSRFIKTKYNVFLSGFNEDEVHMLVASIDDAVLDFHPVEFPSKLPKTGSLTIVESGERRVLLTISQLGEGWGTMLVSNSRGSRFEVSLPFVVLNSHGYSDVQRISGLKHVYLANQLTESSQRMALQGLPPGTSVSDLTVLTKRTVDHGRSWHLLLPPLNEDCALANCSLHLLSLSSLSDATSNSNAPGIVVATGNLGKYLRGTTINTYISKDAGTTWIKIQDGAHSAEISEQGGLIILARQDGPTTELLMSWDIGRTFIRTLFSTVPVLVSSLHTDIEKQGTIFVVAGIVDQSAKGFIASIDFSLLFKRICDGQDYEEWNMEGQTRKCIDGRILSFWRRRADSHCFCDDSADMLKLEAVCPCSLEDWECESRGEGGDCVQRQEVPSDCQETYLLHSGYVKKGESFCEGGLQLGPVLTECPSSSYFYYVLLLLVFGSIALFIYFGFAGKKVKYRID